MNERKIALYMRLSLEDSKTKSTSLQSQEQILRQKLKELPEYAGHEVLTFVDNGYSGLNLERPAVSELLERVENHEIACILMKDTSRFGRDMLKMSYLFESVFPLFYTRVISVTDGYDSDSYKETTGGVDLSLKYMISECYSRDLSKKIRSSRQSKIQRGEIINGLALYGYSLDENKKMFINEEVADNVRMIFKIGKETGSIPAIRTYLLKNKIPPPSMYRALQKNPSFIVPPEKMLWSNFLVTKTLHDLRYIGTYVGNFCERDGVGTNKNKMKDKSEWVIIPDQHPAIIDKALFEEIALIFPEKKHGQKNPKEYPLKSRVFCGYCGKSMSYGSDRKKSHYKCSFSCGIELSPCSKTKILATEVRGEILKVLQSKASEFLSSQQKQNEKPTEQPTAVPDGVQGEIERLKALRKSYYEKMLLQEITSEEFLSLKADLDVELKEYSIYSKHTETTVTQKQKFNQIQGNNQGMAQEILDCTDLPTELAEKLVERVEIFPDNTVTVKLFPEKFFEL